MELCQLERKSKKGPAVRPQEELCTVCGDRASGYHYNALGTHPTSEPSIAYIKNMDQRVFSKKITFNGIWRQVFICLRPPPLLAFCLGW